MQVGALGFKGSMKLLVLSIIGEGPTHGYSIIKKIEEISGRSPSPGTIYPVLKELLDEGLIEVRIRRREGRTVKTYYVTEEGKKLLETKKRDFEELERLARGYRAFRRAGGDKLVEAVRRLIEKLGGGGGEIEEKAREILEFCTARIEEVAGE